MATTLLAAGDIASPIMAAEHTAALLERYPNDIILALGDNAYDTGSAQNYNNYFKPTWGKYQARIHPIPGNHEYLTPRAADYYSFFGFAAGDPTKGYYAMDFRADGWRVAMCNSEIPSQKGSVQWQWLDQELQVHKGVRYVVAWHRPRFSSGLHGASSDLADLFQLCCDRHVSIILCGHEHDYEHLGPANGAGAPDPNGPRTFILGTGGVGLRDFSSLKLPITEKRFIEFGILRLTLTAASYNWQFLSTAGDVPDQGSAIPHVV